MREKMIAKDYCSGFFSQVAVGKRRSFRARKKGVLLIALQNGFSHFFPLLLTTHFLCGEPGRASGTGGATGGDLKIQKQN